ncbi:hypothetical protein [Sphingomonas sp. BK580]|uniref:hypothetical protein n=1 Tax=Sphingomonas sp. BK580 TaxID=2586972 RepID=UPI001620652B|nr:hypothetical protein [Sphingomonas sp. BK580]MBB3692997.1 IS5 family transposase [Sphingomonas sp. BK580]
MNQLPSFYGKGNVDLRGPRGEKGDKGDQGEPGPRGERGEPGKDATGGASPADLKRLSDDVALLKSNVIDEVTARTDGEEALAGRLQSVEASYAKRTDVDFALDARVSEEATARANAILAEATTRQELAATLRSETTTKVSAAIQVEQKARADEYGAIASRLGAIEADYTTAGEVDTKVTAKVSEEAQARADAVSAVASRVQALEASSGSGGSGEDPVARAAIQEEARVRADAISAEATARQNLETKLRGETSAAVSSEAQARSDAVSAEATARQNLAATLRGETDQKVAAGVQEATSASATALGSLATRTAAVEASVGGSPTYLNRAAYFADWPDSRGEIPNGWGLATQTGGAVVRRDGVIGRYAMETSWPGGQGNLFHAVSGLSFGDAGGGVDLGMMIGPGWFVVEVDVSLVEGQLNGSGCYLAGYNTSGVAIVTASWDFALQPDATDTAPGAGLAGRRYRFALLVDFSVNDLASLRFHPMTAWESFLPNVPAKRLRWNLAGVRQATAEEVANKKARVSLGALTGRVATEETVRAQADGVLSQRLSTVEARFDGGGDVDQRVSAKVAEEATARANQDGALASRIDTVETTANGAKASLQTVSQAVSTLDGRQEVYWGVTGTTPEGRVAIGLRKKDGSAGEFLVDTNMRVTGDLLLDGTLTTRTIGANQVTSTAYAVNGTEQTSPAGSGLTVRDLVSTTVTSSATDTYLVNVSADFGGSSPTTSYLYFRILRDGVVIYGPLTIRPTAFGQFGVTFGGMLATSVVDQPGPGTHTYTLQLYADQSGASWTSSYKIMTATAFKR